MKSEASWKFIKGAFLDIGSLRFVMLGLPLKRQGKIDNPPSIIDAKYDDHGIRMN